MSWSRRLGITSSDTRTTGSRPTTAGSNTACDRCAGYAPTAPLRSSSPDSPSSRIYAAATTDAARRFFQRALTTLKVTPTEVVTDAAHVYPRVLDELMPSVWHHVERYENNRIEADHSRLKHRLRPMRGLRTDRTATVVITGLAFLQNLRRGHYEIANETPRTLRVAAASTELASAI
jgi:IS1 family transposase